MMTPREDGEALILHRALAKHRLQYLAQLTPFTVLALFPVDEGSWLCTPYNLADAAQKGWKNGEPRVLCLVEGTLKPLQAVRGRLIGEALLYDGVATIGGAEARAGVFRGILETGLPLASAKGTGHIAQRHAANIIYDRSIELKRLRAERELLERRSTVEGRMRHQLEFMGATLEEWKEGLSGYTVRWSIDDQEYRMSIDEHMHVRAAGICLAGTDLEHNLSTIVEVMQQHGLSAPRRPLADENDDED